MVPQLGQIKQPSSNLAEHLTQEEAIGSPGELGAMLKGCGWHCQGSGDEIKVPVHDGRFFRRLREKEEYQCYSNNEVKAEESTHPVRDSTGSTLVRYILLVSATQMVVYML